MLLLPVSNVCPGGGGLSEEDVDLDPANRNGEPVLVILPSCTIL